MPWCRAPSGAHDQKLVCLTITVLPMCGELSDERMGLSFVRIIVSTNKSVVTMYIIFTFYMLLNVCIKRPLSVRLSTAGHALSSIAPATMAL
jgi:hypothetical protein